MSQFSKLVMTEKGQALMAKMIAGTGDIEFTKVCTSSAEYQEDQLVTLTELSDIRQTSLVSGVTRTNDVTIKIEAAYSNADLTTGYYMRTIGLHAVDPDEGEILYAVTIETSGNCYMPPYNGVTVTAAYIQLYTTVGNSENVSLEVDPGAYATIGQIRELDKKKVDVFDGDISNTKISSFTTSTADYPVPAAGDTTKAAFGKMEKFLKDIKEWMVEKVVTSETFQQQLTKYLVNNGLVTEAGKSALDAAYGKTLTDQITQLNGDFGQILYINDGSDYLETVFHGMRDNSTKFLNVYSATAANRPPSVHCYIKADKHIDKWKKVTAFSLFGSETYENTCVEGAWSGWYQTDHTPRPLTTIAESSTPDTVSLSHLSYTRLGKLVVGWIAGLSIKNTGYGVLITDQMPTAFSQVHVAVMSESQDIYLGNMYIDAGTKSIKINVVTAGQGTGYASFSYVTSDGL